MPSPDNIEVAVDLMRQAQQDPVRRELGIVYQDAEQAPVEFRYVPTDSLIGTNTIITLSTPDSEQVRYYLTHANTGGGEGRWADSLAEAEAELQSIVDFRFRYWSYLAGKGAAEAVVADGKRYEVGPEQEPSARGFLGHGGAEFFFQSLSTGEVLHSANVWLTGGVPTEFAAQMPDTHQIIQPVRYP